MQVVIFVHTSVYLQQFSGGGSVEQAFVIVSVASGHWLELRMMPWLVLRTRYPTL